MPSFARSAELAPLLDPITRALEERSGRYRDATADAHVARDAGVDTIFDFGNLTRDRALNLQAHHRSGVEHVLRERAASAVRAAAADAPVPLRRAAASRAPRSPRGNRGTEPVQPEPCPTDVRGPTAARCRSRRSTSPAPARTRAPDGAPPERSSPEPGRKVPRGDGASLPERLPPAATPPRARSWLPERLARTLAMTRASRRPRFPVTAAGAAWAGPAAGVPVGDTDATTSAGAAGSDRA